MTNEEAIEYLSGKYMPVIPNLQEEKECEKNNTAIDMAISALESQRWIPVTERLPEYDNIYLTYDLHNGLSMMEYHTSDYGTAYCGKGFYSVDENGYKWKDDKVTHWMPLPPSPKEEST